MEAAQDEAATAFRRVYQNWLTEGTLPSAVRETAAKLRNQGFQFASLERSEALFAAELLMEEADAVDATATDTDGVDAVATDTQLIATLYFRAFEDEDVRQYEHFVDLAPEATGAQIEGFTVEAVKAVVELIIAARRDTRQRAIEARRLQQKRNDEQRHVPSVKMDVRAAAEYLHQHIRDQRNHFKIQKLLSFLECAYVAQTGNKLFEQDMQAWEHGLMYPLARKHLDKGCPAGDYQQLGEQERRLLDSVIVEFHNNTPDDLINLSHQEPIWRSARRNDVLSEKILADLLHKHKLLGPGTARCENAILRMGQESDEISTSERRK